MTAVTPAGTGPGAGIPACVRPTRSHPRSTEGGTA